MNFDTYELSIWMGSVILMISGLILMATKTMNDLLAIFMLFGVAALATNFFTYLGMDEKAKDERLRKIGTYATTYSWNITLLFVFIPGYNHVLGPEHTQPFGINGGHHIRHVSNHAGSQHHLKT
jgi:hypothetical protein